MIKTNEDKLGIDYLLPFKRMIKEYEQTGKTEILNKAVKFYVDEMAPLAKTITNLKYEVSYIDFLEKKDKKILKDPPQEPPQESTIETEIEIDDNITIDEQEDQEHDQEPKQEQTD